MAFYPRYVQYLEEGRFFCFSVLACGEHWLPWRGALIMQWHVVMASVSAAVWRQSVHAVA